MVQLLSVPSPGEEMGARERNRLHRHRTYVTAALRISFDEGLEAMTMQRLAADVGASIGSVYTYFPSKTALVAEVQREAIERLATSASSMVVEIARAARASGVDSTVAALAGVVGFGRFWLTASETFPQEMRLLMMLLSDFSLPYEDASRVVPSALRLLGLAENRFENAIELGALGPGRSPERLTVDLAAALTGCLQLATVERFDPELLSPSTTGRGVLDALLGGWGADESAVADAQLLIDGMEASGPLAQPLER